MKNNKRKVHVIGLNSFKFKDLSPKIKELVLRIKYIAAPKTFIGEIKSWVVKEYIENKKFFISESNLELLEWLECTENEVILFSRGDPLWYGIGRILLKRFPQEELLFYPSNTCVQLAFSKLKKPWQGTKIFSIHGRDSDGLVKSLIKKEKSIAILPDPKNNSLELIRQNLRELNLENYYEFWLIEDIGSECEKINLILSQENLPEGISDLYLVVLFKKKLIDEKSSLPLFGINDNNFQTFEDRPNLITKRNIRIQLLADLELPETGTLIDIGSGCGTIGLEAIRIRPKINLTCIDKRFGSQALVKENAKTLGVTPFKIIEGDIKKYLNNELEISFSEVNRVVIGGCDKETKIEIIEAISKFLKKGDIIVLPIITYEVLQKVSNSLRQFNYETNISLIQTFKGLSITEGTRFEPNNPVFIIKAKKK